MLRSISFVLLEFCVLLCIGRELTDEFRHYLAGKRDRRGADEAHISRHAEVAYSTWETGY